MKKVKRIGAIILLIWGVGMICFGILSNQLTFTELEDWRFSVIVFLPGVVGYLLLDAKIKKFYIQRVAQGLLLIKSGLVVLRTVSPSLCPPRIILSPLEARDLCREPYLTTFLGAVLIFLITLWWYKNTKKP